MKNIGTFVCLLFLMVSCVTVYKPQSKFYTQSKAVELGMSKKQFIKTFGYPLTKNMYKKDGKLMEVLYYGELLDYSQFFVESEFYFEDGVLIKQLKGKLESVNDYKVKVED